MVVILSGMRDLGEAVTIAEKIRQAGRKPVPFAGGTISATASIGVTLARAGESVDEVIARADAAMYQAKQTGRDQVVPVASTA